MVSGPASPAHDGGRLQYQHFRDLQELDGSPRRAIRVDELVALSAVLGIDVPDLLKPIETIRQERAFELLRNLDDNGRRLAEVARERVALFQELMLCAVDDPELHEFVMNRRYGRPSGPRAQHILQVGGEGGATIPIAADKIADGFANFEAAILAQATDNAEVTLWARSRG